MQDNIGIFVDQNGKLLQDGRICWSEAPASVIIDRPYAIARLPKYVEVGNHLHHAFPLQLIIIFIYYYLMLNFIFECMIPADSVS